jgi:SAM-dependent methyltransferase
MIVIVVCHNNLGYTKKFVESVLRAKNDMTGVKIVMVNNGSTDGTKEYLSTLSVPFVIYENAKNEWFTVANKAIIDLYPAEDVYMVNNDVVVMDGWLSGRVWLSGYGALGAVQLSPYDVRLITFAGGGEDFARHKAMWEWKLPKKDILPTDWLTGCGLMISRAAYDTVGGLDTGLKHYCQDSDISLRLLKAGYTIGVCRDMRIVHFAGQTTEMVVKAGNQEVLKQGQADQRNFAAKHGVKCGDFDFRLPVSDMKAHYEKYFDNDVMQMRNIEASRVEAADLLKVFDWKDKNVLELGCAYGRVVAELQASGVNAHGLELSETAVKRGQVQFVSAGDLMEFNGSFDAIFSKAVLEHVPSDKIYPLISKIYKCLNDGGITHHNIDTEKGTDPTHITIVPIEQWKAIFEACGFKTVEIKHLHDGIYWCTWEKIKLAAGGADYFDKAYFEDATKNGLKDSFKRYFADGFEVANRLELLIPEMKKDWAILEVGCAYGHTLNALKEKGYHFLMGTDISQYSVDKGIEEFKLNLFQSDIEKEPMVKNCYNLITSCITLEHIHKENADFVVKSLYDATLPGGYNYHAIDLIQGQDTTHYCIKPRQWWIDLFVKHGFTELPLTEKQDQLNWFLFRRLK